MQLEASGGGVTGAVNFSLADASSSSSVRLTPDGLLSGAAYPAGDTELQVTARGQTASGDVQTARRTILLRVQPDPAARDLGVFLHVSDLHLRSLTASGPGSYGQDSTEDLVRSTASLLAALTGDFIVITGDLAGHDNTAAIPLFSAVKAILDEHLPTMRFIVSLGNNDVTPDYHLAADDGQLAALAAAYGDAWLSEETARETFLRGGYFETDVSLTNCLRVLTLNTVWWSSHHWPANATDSDPAGQFAWLESRLSAARANNCTVLLQSHIPPGVAAYDGKALWSESYMASFFDLVDTFADVISAGLFGHVHHDEVRVHESLPMLVAPAVSPIYENNPGVRYVVYDRASFDIVEYVQFKGELGGPWSRFYATRDFDLAPVNAAAIRDVHEAVAADAALLDDYLTVNTVDHGQACQGDETCRRRHVCAIVHFQKADFDACMDQA